MSAAHETLARILRITPEVLLDLDAKMIKLTNKSGVLDKIVEENSILTSRTLDELGLSKEKATAEEVYGVLVDRLKHMDKDLYDFLDKPKLADLSQACGKICDTARLLNDPQKGFFLKKEKALAMLEKFPPQNILDYFGYKTVAELVEKEGLSSVFCALRFAQDEAWMHRFFDEAYDDLTIDDFERREVEIKILETKWLKVAEKFLKKKYHNLSHLKELGVIFIIPLSISTPGETMRMFTLLLHYLNEVPFYSKLFYEFSTHPDFATKLKSLLRGDVPDGTAPVSENVTWRIVQRYLSKVDFSDFRLLEPHINPEAEHWYKATGDLAKLNAIIADKGHLLGFWHGLDFVGDFFPNVQGEEKLISFDLIDLVMSLVEKGEAKYLYHQQEALWNKIFIEYLGRDKMDKLIEQNIIDGFIKL
ncbi:MAG: hypothetical protein Q7S32_04285 [bacterium]|nr:hypothetical protein [bacterium]